MMDFSGLWIPLVTPFRGGHFDRPALGSLVEQLVADGVAGFVACGSTGEAAMLDDAEQEQSLATTIEHARGRPVLMGLSGVASAAIARRARAIAQRHDVAAFLVAAPPYVRPSQAALRVHFETLAEALPRPLVVYDIPARTGVRIEVATLLALAAHPNIVAVKDCSGDRAAAQAVLTDGRLALLAGNDDELFDQLARGAVGSITASAHLATARFVQLHELLSQGRLQAARQLWRGLAELTRLAFREPNPAPVKGALARLGRITDDVRAPLLPASAATVDALLASCELLSPR